MEITFEQLKNQQGSSKIQKKKEISFDELKKQKGIQPSDPTQTPKSDVKGGFLGELFTGNTQRFGNTLGQTANLKNATKLFEEAQNQNIKTETEILNRIKTATPEQKEKLFSILEMNRQSAPQLENFTGDVINKTNKQVLGEALGTGIEALGGGILTKGAGAIVNAGTKLQKAGQLAKVGAQFGGASGVAESLKRDEDIEDIATSGVKSALGGAVLGGGLSLAGNVISKTFSKKPQLPNQIAGDILQGTSKEQDIGQRVLSKINKEGIKTYDDLSKTIQNNIDDLTKQKDNILANNTGNIKLRDLDLINDRTGERLDLNFVETALEELRDFARSTNDIKLFSDINKKLVKAETRGLTLTELESIARLHGNKLKGFNANGQLSSGLSKQAAENTRKGVKDTIRQISGDTNLKKIDDEISNNIKVKNLSNKMIERVNKLKQRRQEQGPFAKLGGLIGRVINTFTGGSASGIARSLLFNLSPQRASQRVLNSLDLERALQKNLKLLETATTSKNETVIRKALQQLIKNVEIPQIGRKIN